MAPKKKPTDDKKKRKKKKPTDPVEAQKAEQQVLLKGMQELEKEPPPQGQGPPDPTGGKSGLR